MVGYVVLSTIFFNWQDGMFCVLSVTSEHITSIFDSHIDRLTDSLTDIHTDSHNKGASWSMLINNMFTSQVM